MPVSPAELAALPTLADYRADYEQLRDQLPIALMEVAWPSLRVTYMNAVARALTGYGAADLAAGLSGLALLDEESQRRILDIGAQQLAHTVAQGLPYQRQRGQQLYEFTGKRKDGSTFPAEVQAAYILDCRKLPAGVRFMFRDLTELRRREEERRHREVQARQSQKLDSLGELAGGIAHDFNNLFTAALGNLHLLGVELAGNQAAVELADEVERAVRRGAALVQHLLEFSRPQVERRETIDLVQLVTKTTALVAPSFPPDVRLEVGGLAAGSVASGNPGALQQVLVSLLVNARDAIAERGTITMSIERMRLSPPDRWTPAGLAAGVYHAITVRDDGCGMSEETRERAFDPYFSTKGPVPGRGLGLSIGLSIARSHGGWLAAESEPGVGSTFRLFLPAVENRAR
ncbi:MAG: two-component system sensor histidine kinase NtrB [Hyphomicrobiales bacterium]